jgi:hypothetical protein
MKIGVMLWRIMMIMGTQSKCNQVKRLSGGNTSNKNKSLIEKEYGREKS